MADVPNVYENCLINVYPNPARDVLNISWKGITEGEIRVNIVDMTGKLFSSTTMPAMPGNSVIMIGNLPAGVYICVLHNAGCRYYSKFSVLR